MLGGGAERVAATIVSNLPNTISRKLITIYDSEIKYNIPEKPTTLLKYSSNKILRKIMLPFSILKNIIICKKEAPKIVLSFLDYDNILNIITSIVCDYTAIISVHGVPSFQKSIYFGGESIQKLLFSLAKIKGCPIIAVSQGIKDELISDYKINSESITILYNPIDIPTIQTLSSEDIYEKNIFNIPTIITVGSLAVAKGQWHLIRAFAELRHTHNAHLLILGEGGERQYLETLVDDYNLSENVYFMGWQENPYKYMSRATLFVSSSISEALPNVLTEAMACGCPIIASNCSQGVHEIIGDDDKNGLIADKMSGIRYNASAPLDKGERNLVELMKLVLDDENLQKSLSLNGKERANFFSVEVRMKEYESFLRSYL